MTTTRTKCSTYGCDYTGTYIEGELWWCGIHAPSKVAARRAKQYKIYDDRSIARNEQWRRAAAERFACTGISTEALEGGVVAELLAACEAVYKMAFDEAFSDEFTQLEAAIAKARGTA